MSIDSKYIINYQGPFGDTELEDVVEKLNALPSSFGFQKWGYDQIQGETKWSRDDEVIEIALGASTLLQVIRRDDDRRWEVIYNYGDTRNTK